MSIDFKETVCIYHKNCVDGWASAVVFEMGCRAQANSPDPSGIPYIAANYGDPLPDVRGKRVALVDFSYKRKQMEELCAEAKRVTVIDHHITAFEELKDFQNPKFVCKIDLNCSGARITWDTCFPGVPAPWWVLYSEDYDLWKHQLPDSKAINLFLSQFPKTFENWFNLHSDPNGLAVARTIGTNLLMYHNMNVGLIASQARVVAFPTLGADVEFVPVVNCPGYYASDVGGELNKKSLWSVCWHQIKDGRYKYSLRSRPEYDVSIIAKAYGGGGHKNAAGFLSDKKLA